MMLPLAIAGLLVGEAGLLLWLRRGARAQGQGGARRLLPAWLCTQVVALSAVMAGAAGEKSYRWYSRLPRPATAEIYLPFEAAGDPGLHAALAAQRPDTPPAPTDDREQFAEWQRDLRRALRERVFALHEPERIGAIRFEVLHTERVGSDVVRKLIAFESFDGTRVPAYLCEPDGQGTKPAFLVLAGHGRGIIETAGLENSYHHSAALELARAGFVTLAPELRGFGYLGERIDNEHNFMAYNALLAGTFYKAVLVKDVQYAFELLRSHPGVDPERIGVTGVSFGGEVAATYAALDERVGCAIVQGFGSARPAATGERGSAATQPPHLCHLIPGQNRLMRPLDLFLLIAPRPLLLVRGSREKTDPCNVRSELLAAYALWDREDRLECERPSGGHEYFTAPAVSFARRFW